MLRPVRQLSGGVESDGKPWKAAMPCVKMDRVARVQASDGAYQGVVGRFTFACW